ncbi:hypothetical protein [Thiomicrorhabdus chilensis]|uniref:hypothetical protein n=1 Tax=Thiomicrorhabdus chilensis TaxID=63656 RepID=UPI00048D6AF8|nr:hypothetical protein [Thiomicrorhabdus chilensis]
MLNYIYRTATPVDKQPSIYLHVWRVMEVIFEDESFACIVGLKPDGGARRTTPIVALEKVKHDGKDVYKAITESGREYILAKSGLTDESRDMNDVIADFKSQSKHGNFRMNLLSPKEWKNRYGKANLH